MLNLTCGKRQDKFLKRKKTLSGNLEAKQNDNLLANYLKFTKKPNKILTRPRDFRKKIIEYLIELESIFLRHKWWWSSCCENFISTACKNYLQKSRNFS